MSNLVIGFLETLHSFPERQFVLSRLVPTSKKVGEVVGDNLFRCSMIIFGQFVSVLNDYFRMVTVCCCCLEALFVLGLSVSSRIHHKRILDLPVPGSLVLYLHQTWLNGP